MGKKILGDYEKATPRPWAWEWDEGTGNITIYQPTDALHSTEIGEIFCPDHKNEEAKIQAEQEAELIVSLVNQHHEEAQQ